LTELKFNKSYKLLIETHSGAWVEVKPPLMLEFEITRNNLATANTGRFVLYNLSRQTRNAIFQDRWEHEKRLAVQLYAGYIQNKKADAPIPLIFNGRVMEAISYKDNINMKTEIDAWDGGVSNSETLLNETVDATKPIEATITSIAKQCPNIEKVTITSNIPQPKKDVVLFGDVAKNLSKLTNTQWFIDNQELFLLNSGEYVEGLPCIIDASSGLLTSPKRSGAQLSFDMLFEPHVRVGQIVEIKSIGEPIYNGRYIVTGFKHSGKIGFGGDAPTITTLYLWVGVNRFQSLKTIGVKSHISLPTRIIKEGGEMIA